MSDKEMTYFLGKLEPFVRRRALLIFKFNNDKDELVQDAVVHAYFIAESASRRRHFERINKYSVSRYAIKSAASRREVPCVKKVSWTDALRVEEPEPFQDDFYYRTLELTSTLRDPADIAQERIDLYDFQKTLPEKLQQILDLLLLQYRALDVTSKFTARKLGRKIVTFFQNEAYAKKAGLK